MTALWQAGVGAVLTVFLAGISEAIGQSVVLFVNRVQPARFVLSLLINALLVAFGYAFIVLSTWATFFLPGSHPIALGVLALAVAFSYAPLLGAFLGALPYAGTAVLFALRIWQLLAMAAAIAPVAHISIFVSAAHVALGWTVMIVAQHTLGKPIADLGVRLADAAAGKTIVQERVAVGRAVHQFRRANTPVSAGSAPASERKKAVGFPVFAVIILTFVFVAFIVAVLTPLHNAIAGSVTGIFLRASIDLVWLTIVAIVVAAFLAPLETLGWWAGWYGDKVDPHAAHATSGAPAATLTFSKGEGDTHRYVVYLDGICQSSSRYTPDVEGFLDALTPELPQGVQLIRGIMAYSVINRPLDDDPMYARFWKLIELLRVGARTQILGMFINIRNVMIVAVSADQRYGPLYNLGIAQVIYNALLERGYRKRSRTPITMIGYSGGGQMCVETAPLLELALGAPVEVISLGGVMTGTAPFMHFDHLHHMKGSKDIIEPLGPIMFSSRWKMFMKSRWNKALKAGRITLIPLGPVRHQVPGGMLDPEYKLPDGRSALRNTLDHINAILNPKSVSSP